jgi:hypothetical protein
MIFRTIIGCGDGRGGGGSKEVPKSDCFDKKCSANEMFFSSKNYFIRNFTIFNEWLVLGREGSMFVYS